MKRPVTLIAGAIVGVLALAGCTSGGGGDPSADPGTGTIQFVGPEDPAVFAPVISSFEKKYPDIAVQYTQVPFDTYATTMQQRLSAKDSTIDVFAVDQPNLAQIAAQG
ncbi:MAG: extracellular solute-binding protein, partial [Cumulibacter sp.]